MAAHPDFADTKTKIMKIISFWDPMKVQPGKPHGAPEDEYEPEAARIAAYVLKHREPGNPLSLQALKTEIERLWQLMYGETCPNSLEIAQNIIQQFP